MVFHGSQCEIMSCFGQETSSMVGHPNLETSPQSGGLIAS